MYYERLSPLRFRSKVRAQMRNEVNGPPLKYAGYAVYTAVCDYSGIHTDTSKVRRSLLSVAGLMAEFRPTTQMIH